MDEEQLMVQDILNYGDKNMMFVCKLHNDGEEFTKYSGLSLCKNAIQYETIIGTDYDLLLGRYFLILSDINGVIDLKFIISSTNKQVLNIKSYINNLKLYDAITKKYSKPLEYKIIVLEDALYKLLNNTFGTKINLNDYKVYMTGEDTLNSCELGFEYINPNSQITKFSISTISISQLESIKPSLYKYFNDCLKAIQFINTQFYKDYINFQEFLKIKLNPNRIKSKLKYQKISSLMETLNLNNFEDLKTVFLDDIITNKTEQLLNKFQSVEKLCNYRQYGCMQYKIPCKNIPMSIASDKLKYDLYGCGFTLLIPDQYEKFESETTKKMVKFINSLIKFGKYEEVNNSCEKLILLKC
jgi:hypothetical protein